MGDRWTDGVADLRCGRWQDALADVERVDAVIVDAPYSAKTHVGFNAGMATANKATDAWCERVGKDDKRARRRTITYGAWSADDVRRFVSYWDPRCAGWFVTITDHNLAPEWAAAFASLGRYVFAPMPFIEPGKQPRMTGDGPAMWTCWIVVSRPRREPWSKWGSLPGGYILPKGQGEKKAVVGGKPMWLMRALVRDYTRPGDLIADPCAGGATTLRAAQLEGRRAVGSEMDPDTYAKAVERLAAPYTPALRMDAPQAVQEDLL